MSRTLLCLALVCAWMPGTTACGGGDGVGGDVTVGDPGPLDPGNMADTADVKHGTDLEVTIVFPDYGQDTGNPDVDVSGGDLTTDAGGSLQECVNGDDCPSGLCVEDASGVKYCAPPCMDQECPEGWKCAQITTSGDTTFICLPAAQYLCRPCEDHDDCAPAGLLSTDRCVDYGPVGRFCGKDCEGEGECPDGYTCAELQVRDGESTYQCVPVTGECMCEEEFIVGGFVTVCYLENEFGRCEGSSQCSADGMTTCTAITPAEESCNGQDDNCDGTTDEGIEAAACEKAFGEYVCQGFEVCEGGSLVCDAPEPANEKCDGVDNDCDGITDEPDAEGCTKYYLDQDDDSYGLDAEFKCLCGALAPYSVQVKGDCDDANPNANPGAAEACDGVDNDCDGLTDEEDSVGCVDLYRDMDQDGFGGIGVSKCLCASDADYTVEVGGDCNDGDPDVFPGAAEVCNGVDDDCNGVDDDEDALGCLVYHLDADDDGYGVEADSKCLCGPSGAWSALEAGDCDDGTVAVNPGVVEVCNGGVDDDCDGDTDEENAQGCQELYEDLDGDDYGVPGAEPFCLCVPNPPIVGTQTGDCDDGNAFANPGQTEKCGNGVDDDCDGVTDEEGGAECQVLFRDGDDDGYGVDGDSKCLCGGEGDYTAVQAGDCNDGDPDAHPGQVEACNEKDDDCNGQTDEENADGCTTFYFDGDGDAHGLTGNARCLCDPDGKWEALQGGDCNDGDIEVYPSATEQCNGKDDDCDGGVDEEGAVGCQERYYDGDEDGYGVTTNSHCLCEPEGKYSALNQGDCDDGNPAVNPGTNETCNGGIDDDCNGQTDEEDAGGCGTWYLNVDGDGFGDGTQFKCLCAATGQYDVQQAGDCDDGVATTYPDAPESCNGIDDDCDGGTDETWPDKGQECDGPDDDLCQEGLWECNVAGTDVACSDTTLTDAEVCNNQDDDCDGDTDEDFPDKGLDCDGPDGDSCLEGKWECNGNILVCSDLTGTISELCNHQDDDCDGQTDEEFPDKGLDCDGLDGDECLEGKWECNGTDLVCSDLTGTTSEVCNGQDDDCNGLTDETFPDKGQPCDGPDGDLCKEANWECNGVSLVCQDFTATDTELCNNVDDDCDGSTDEDFPTKGQPCDGPDQDLCSEGTLECNGTVLVCTDNTSNNQEVCNNEDDDCDGQTDEGFPTKGQPCDGPDLDQCNEGTLECNGSLLACTDNTGNNSEVCNNQDDDCNGFTDENLSQPCSTICGSGIETCNSGGWFNCTAQQPLNCMNYLNCNVEPMCTGICPGAPPESCNDKDDDCDGQTDEEWWNSDAIGADFPDTWYGPSLANCTSGSCQGTTSGRLLPEGDEDWLSVYKSETNDWIVDLKGKVWFKGPALSNRWYEVCICWTQNSYCDESSKVCGTSQGGAEVILQTNNGDSWGSDDQAYLDIQVKPAISSVDWSCTQWTLTWSVWE